jgi:ADP-L-glycero-D-manno-heptose 6-epimerase
LRFPAQELFVRLSQTFPFLSATNSVSNLLVTGGAGFIGSNLVLALQEKYPDARLTAIDDFRSGDFKNLQGYRGDLVAENLASLDWRAQFGDEIFDAIFHLASITDTTNHDQFAQVHDNVESFRRLLDFARPSKTRIIYASSAATYGLASGVNSEGDDAAPANVYAFSKVIMDNLARRADWTIVGLRYFNVYGPREAHKGVPASMIYHLTQQMSAGRRPRVFKYGEQKRDFVYVKDIVEGTLLALEAEESGIYNLGSGQARSFNELISILNQSLGTDLAPEYFDNPYAHYQPHTEADLTKVQASLGYKPQFSLEAGVADYLKWLYREEAR